MRKKNDILRINDKLLKIDSVDGIALRAHNETDGSICYVAEEGSFMAVGKNERAACFALRKKIFNSKTEEQRINEFVEQHPPEQMLTAEEWVEVHQKLTGSCYKGGYYFLRNNGIKLYETYTTLDFLEIVGNAYSSELFDKLKQIYAVNLQTTQGGIANA